MIRRLWEDAREVRRGRPRPLSGSEGASERSPPNESRAAALLAPRVAVSFWTVLGVVCLLLGLPVVVLVSDAAWVRDFGFLVGAGAAFLIVGIIESAMERGEPGDETTPGNDEA